MRQNSDSGRDHNPAVQLQGPFLQGRLIPPPAHRNVVMIAAGTGVNPMVQLIRDYLVVGGNNKNAVMGTHSRLVLLWQNSMEGDLYCSDELTALQARAKGLLEVTALISGDMTRRNIPGNTFRRAKARLMKKGAEAGLVPTAGMHPGGRRDSLDREGGGAEQQQAALARDMPEGLDRLELGRELSRVSEEDSNFTRASRERSSRSTGGGGGRDLDRGGSGGSRSDLPWSSNSGKRRSKSGGRQYRGEGGGGGGESKTPSGSGMERPRRAHRENLWSEEAGQEDGGGNNTESTNALSSDPQGGLPNRRVSRDNAARNLTGRRGGGGGGRAADTARSGIRLADSIRAAGVDRGRWAKGAGSKNNGGQQKGPGGRSGGSGGGKGKGSHFFGARNNRVDVVEYSSSDGQPKAAGAAAPAGPRRKTKRGAPRKRAAGRVAGPPGASPLDDVSVVYIVWGRGGGGSLLVRVPGGSRRVAGAGYSCLRRQPSDLSACSAHGAARCNERFRTKQGRGNLELVFFVTRSYTQLLSPTKM